MYQFYLSGPFKDSKEDILVLTDAFTKFTQASVTPTQKEITIAKMLMDKWFYVYGIPAYMVLCMGTLLYHHCRTHYYIQHLAVKLSTN